MSEVKEKKTVVKKATKTTEVILGSAALKLQAAVQALTKGTEEISKLTETADEYTLKIGVMQDELSELEQRKKNEIAQTKIDVQLAFDQNRQEYVEKYAQEKGLLLVDETQWNDVNQELSTIKREFDANVQKQVSAAVASAKKEAEMQLALAKLEYEKKEADNAANIKQLQMQNAFLEKQVSDWQKALEAERQAGVERQKASAIGTLNLGQNAR